MSFRFKLDTVLRFRQSVEQVEEAALYRIVQEVTEVELELKQLQTKQVQLRAQREQDLTRMLPAVHLMEIAERELELEKATNILRGRMEELETRRLQQMAVYRAAHQDRQILSELRDRQRQAFQMEQRRQEQKTLDDLFLARGKVGN
jgi:flagellar FliJ protein